MEKYLNELDFAKRIAYEAGKMMVSGIQRGVQVSYKKDGSIVTNVERAINQFVIESVNSTFPRHSVASEEGSAVKIGSDYTWVCDPIDGSLPYTMEIPTAVFSITLVNRMGCPVVAVVYEPFLHDLYWGVNQNGSYKNGRPLKVNMDSSIQTATIGNSGRTSPFVEATKFKTSLFEKSNHSVVLNSVIYESMLVASGKISATVMTGNAFHDAASAKLIVEEAGGKVTGLFGNDQRYDCSICGAVITNGSNLHDSIIELAKVFKLG